MRKLKFIETVKWVTCADLRGRWRMDGRGGGALLRHTVCQIITAIIFPEVGNLIGGIPLT